MPLIQLLLSLAIIGLVVWLILQLPLPEPFKKVIQVIAILVLILYVIQLLGVPMGLRLCP